MTHPITIVVDLQALVCIDVHVFIIFSLFRGQPHKPPHWQLIHEELIPVVLLDSLSEGGCLAVIQHIGTDNFLRDISCMRQPVSSLSADHLGEIWSYVHRPVRVESRCCWCANGDVSKTFLPTATQPMRCLCTAAGHCLRSKANPCLIVHCKEESGDCRL